MPQLRDFNPQELANTAWAYAAAGHAAAALLDAIAAAAAPRLCDFNPQALANTAWAYTAADVPSDVLFEGSHFAELCDATAESFMPAQLHQLHQWLLWLDERNLACNPTDTTCQTFGLTPP